MLARHLRQVAGAASRYAEAGAAAESKKSEEVGGGAQEQT